MVRSRVKRKRKKIYEEISKNKEEKHKKKFEELVAIANENSNKLRQQMKNLKTE